jgi:hypothetical protein
MKQFVLSGWLAALVCNMASGCVAQELILAQAPTTQSGDAQSPGLINNDLQKVQGSIEGRQADRRHLYPLA